MQTSKQHILERIEGWPLGKLWVFALKQAWAAIFGGLMLAAIILTHFVDLPWLARADWLFLFAIAVQIVLLLTRLEKPHEVITILVFHLVGLGMEVFKTSSLIGSWSYQGDAFFHVANVPLYSGFMYAAVGSYIARSWRVLELKFSNMPKRIYTVLFALAVYVNFFSHHFVPDIRLLLFVAVALLYGRTWVSYKLHVATHKIPLLLGLLFVAVFIWIAENIATFTRTWLYPDQMLGWHLVSVQKIGSWFLLMMISFILIDLLHSLRRQRR
jgi:uncharacterized membrane protein YoaT (DUF817 family)